MELCCQQDTRRDAVRRKIGWNGLDYVEVAQDQLSLAVYFLGKLPAEFKPENPNDPTQYLQLSGGRRVTDIRIVKVDPHIEANPEKDDFLTVYLDKYGDFSTYTLTLVGYGLCLMSVAAAGDLVAEGRNLVIVALVGTNLHVRIFDGGGNKVVDKAEANLVGGETLAALKQRLSPVPDVASLSTIDKQKIMADAASIAGHAPLAGVANIDPRYQSVDFSFKVDCPTGLDCAAACGCEPPDLDEPEINYLAKDYASFRQLLLDRLAVLMPDWTERHVPDLGIALVELLAYTGDYLSYYQDAVATEAYLSTARQRISVRRHVRLVDYVLHEGCNSRAWVSVEVDSQVSLHSSDVAFITGLGSGQPGGAAVLAWGDLAYVPASSYVVFEPLPSQPPTALTFTKERSAMCFYTWGERECCLPKGSTSAALLDVWSLEDPHFLRLGDVLIFEEAVGPKTGQRADADPLRRHPVRITGITRGVDPLIPDAEGQPRRYVEIQWAQEDALPFTFCVSAMGPAPACQYLENISIACGNVLLVDLGKSVDIECLGEVPESSSPAACECVGLPGEIQRSPGRFRPALSKSPLTFSAPLPSDVPPRKPAAAMLLQDERSALPAVRLYSLAGQWRRFFAQPSVCSLASAIRIVDDATGVWLQFPKDQLPGPLAALFGDGKLPATRWDARYDLFESGPEDAHFVVETDNDGIAHLRFGDGVLGAQPEAASVFFAAYRYGNGKAGNVGAEAISLAVLGNTKIEGAKLTVRNPLPAVGGMDPEPVAEAKLYAPTTFRKQIERAITADDYRLLAERDGRLQRASAELVWTGSWYEADVAVDPLGTETAEAALLKAVDGNLHPFRRMGHDLRVLAARYVPIDLKLDICVLPYFQQAHVKAALLEVFGNRRLANGKLGFFHPDNLSFGASIDVSRLVAAGMAVAGVECVRVTGLKRWSEADRGELDKGLLALSLHEIAQLDNDPNYPEHGQLELTLSGGR